MDDVKGCKVREDAYVKEDVIVSTELEMRGVREENTRLKKQLQQIEKDFKTLQRQFIDVLRQQSKSPSNTEEQELVSLRLGTNNIIPTEETKKEKTHHSSNSVTCDIKGDTTEHGLGYNTPERLKRGDGPVNLGKKEGPPSLVLKTVRSGDEEESFQTSVKRARVCVRARCDTPTMNDGCQWRKYGQKIAKGNPCPRAYYRCTVSPSCPVRKQVQRCMDDISILITTYEGTHNHPLPTSAAASMLLSTSPLSSSTSQPHNLHGPLAWTSHSSATTPFSTINLDLTANPSSFSLYASSNSSQQNPRAPTTLSFSPNMVDNPSAWGTGEFSYNNIFHNSTNMISAGSKTTQEQKYLSSCLEKFNQVSSQQALTETLTKAITSNPSFRSVIAAVVSTMAANGGAGKVNGMIDDDHIPAADSNSLSSK